MNETPITILRKQIRVYEGFLNHITLMCINDEIESSKYNKLICEIELKKKEFENAIIILNERGKEGQAKPSE